MSIFNNIIWTIKIVTVSLGVILAIHLVDKYLKIHTKIDIFKELDNKPSYHIDSLPAEPHLRQVDNTPTTTSEADMETELSKLIITGLNTN